MQASWQQQNQTVWCGNVLVCLLSFALVTCIIWGENGWYYVDVCNNATKQLVGYPTKCARVFSCSFTFFFVSHNVAIILRFIIMLCFLLHWIFLLWMVLWSGKRNKSFCRSMTTFCLLVRFANTYTVHNSGRIVFRCFEKRKDGDQLRSLILSFSL